MTRIFKPDSGQALEIQDEGGSAALTVETDGDVTVDAGNLVIGTAGKGIDFSAASHAAGMTSELLDDYEEGTWTAAITDGSDNAMRITANECSYIKVGRIVFISGRLVTDLIQSASGAIRVTGLPFSSKSDNSGASAITIGYAGGWNITADESVVLRVSNDSTLMNFFIWNAVDGVASFTAAEWSANGQMQFGGTYQANA